MILLRFFLFLLPCLFLITRVVAQAQTTGSVSTSNVTNLVDLVDAVSYGDASSRLSDIWYDPYDVQVSPDSIVIFYRSKQRETDHGILIYSNGRPSSSFEREVFKRVYVVAHGQIILFREVRAKVEPAYKVEEKIIWPR